MPLVHRSVDPVQVSSEKLEGKLGKYECEFVAVNNETLTNVLRQLVSLVSHASDIFSETATLADKVKDRIRRVKLRLDELEAKSDLFDPKLVPVPEGNLDDVPNISKFSSKYTLESKLFCETGRPRFLKALYDVAGSHTPNFPSRSPVTSSEGWFTELGNISNTNTSATGSDGKRPASFAALRDWKLEESLVENNNAPDGDQKRRLSSVELTKSVLPLPSQLVQVDITGQIFDRMRKSRRSLVVHTKRIRKSRRRNTICGSMPNKECGIQTSFSSVNSPNADHRNKKYGIDSGHWSSCTSSGQNGRQSAASAPSPYDPTCLSTSSDFLFDDEDRCLTPQLENFTDGLVSDTDSVDTDGYFTSFRSDCGFPKSKKSSPDEDSPQDSNVNSSGDGGSQNPVDLNVTTSTVVSVESEYDLFGKGSTSTTASSCGTVVLRNKPAPPSRTDAKDPGETKHSLSQHDDSGWEERLKRKSLIERIPSLVVVTPSPSCSSGSPSTPRGTREPSIPSESSESDSDRLTPKADEFLQSNGSECGTLSDTDSELRSELALVLRPSSNASSSGTLSSGNSSTLTLTGGSTSTASAQFGPGVLPQPDVIPDVQVIRTKGAPKLDISQEYFSLDTVLFNSSVEEEELLQRLKAEANGRLVEGKTNNVHSKNEVGVRQSPCTSPTTPIDSSSSEKDGLLESLGPATSTNIRGARVVLDANGEIIFASETLKRKRKHKVSFDPGSAVKEMNYEECSSSYGRIRESVYDRIRKDSNASNTSVNGNEKLYECIEEIRKLNMAHPYLHLVQAPPTPKNGGSDVIDSTSPGPQSPFSDHDSTSSPLSSSWNSLAAKYASRPPPNLPNEAAFDTEQTNTLLETDLDSEIPPSMPDLKNLPKIKDRLKRNESYRMANTDDVNGNAKPEETLHLRANKVLLSRHTLQPSFTFPTNETSTTGSGIRRISRRMSFASNAKEGVESPNGNLHLNKKRDILEEDPAFVQQILSMSTSSARSPQGVGLSNSFSSPGRPHTLSKLALSIEDTPSFLRKDSPPTMDDISKEIYRFRKKFNIRPDATSRPLVPSGPNQPKANFYGNHTRTAMDRDHYLGITRRISGSSSPSSSLASTSSEQFYHHELQSKQNSTIPLGFPKLTVQERRTDTTTPLSSSTPVKKVVSSSSYYRKNGDELQCMSPIIPSSSDNFNSSITREPHHYYQNPHDSISNYNEKRRSFSSMLQPRIPATLRNFSSSGRKIFPTLVTSGALNSSSNTYSRTSSSNSSSRNLDGRFGNNPSSYDYPLARDSWNAGMSHQDQLVAKYRRKSMSLAESSSGCIPIGGSPRTTLNDFKKLLQAAKPKQTTVSAVEALKPKLGSK